MNDHLWQVPLVVMAGIILVELLIMALTRRGWWPHPSRRARTVALALLTLLGLGVGIQALGPDLVDQLASVAAAVATIAALWLTWQSYKATRDGSVTQDSDADVDADDQAEVR